MRIAVLWVVLTAGTSVFFAMLAATCSHRADVPTLGRPNTMEYVWFVIPWLIIVLCAAPAVHRVLAVERDADMKLAVHQHGPTQTAKERP